MEHLFEDIVYLSNRRDGDPELDAFVHELLGWEYYPSVRRGMRSYHAHWNRGTQRIYELPAVTTDVAAAKQLLHSNFSFVFDRTLNKFVVTEDWTETTLSASTYPILCCIAAIVVSAMHKGENDL